MNKTVRFAAVSLLLSMMTASAAYAEDAAPAAGNAMPPPAMRAQDPQKAADKKAEEELELKDRKAEMLLRIDHQMAEMQKSKSCIEAATTREALHACMPPPPGGGMGMGGMGMGGPGMMQGGKQGGPGMMGGQGMGGPGMQGGNMMGKPEGMPSGGQPPSGAPAQ